MSKAIFTSSQAAALFSEYETACAEGNLVEINRLLPLVEFPTYAPKPRPETLAADNATEWKAQKAARIERMILDRQEARFDTF